MHLIVGLVLAAIGVFLLLGKDWARIAGMVVAALAAVINFTWLPYSPGWAILAIAVNVLVIWALASTLQAPVPRPSRQATANPKPDSERLS